MRLSFRNFSFDFSQKTYVMGILNVTPDSFSDGGLFLDGRSAIERALRMEAEGADIIDIGGESTRPGSEPVSPEEELRRTIPVIEAISGRLRIPVSIDTYKAEVARRAIEAGAAMVNDISGLRFDPEMADTLSQYDVALVLMHIKGTPRNMQKSPVYTNLFSEITDYLKESINMATERGIAKERIVIDPGIGFGKTLEHNLQIINNLDRLSPLCRPVLIGASRKSFIGRILNNAPASERLEGTAAAVAISVMKGANIVRVHDVREMSRVVKVADAIRREEI
ncbi:Dihydropteroate synthase [hydrothermal vent metagenome]|uniref:dihydropteroate synthase n=1 Tax=hydrothermal vent metagenome TaxID=652676 RepID=A0A3B1CRB8_9ZZZZ